MASIYLDASFVSACVTDRADPTSIYRRNFSREWWDAQRKHHELFISREVINELSSKLFKRSAEALAWVVDVPRLAINEEVAGVAKLLVTEHVMPGPALGDALHVAISAVHRCEYLL